MGCGGRLLCARGLAAAEGGESEDDRPDTEAQRAGEL
jgi:hypothetical protein